MGDSETDSGVVKDVTSGTSATKVVTE
jgi:hypothetical protein